MTSADSPRQSTSAGESILPQHYGLFYGGDWHKAAAGGAIESHNPATGEFIASVAAATAVDVDKAVGAARHGQPEWAALSPVQRGDRVRELAQRVRENADSLARLDARDSGNPYSGMLFDVGVAARLLEFFAGLATEIKGETIPMGAGKLNFAVREPLGVVARLVPFNHPIMFACIKSAAPLIAGNSVIIKPSEYTPLSTLRLAELAADLFPPGVFNVLNGRGDTGAALARHPGVDSISLVGSIPTGRAVMAGASETLKPVLLELGGKNALIVYPDVDLDKAADGVVKGMNFTWTAGQSCGSTSRVFAHADIHDALLEKIRLRMDDITLGLPEDPDCQMGSLTSEPQLKKSIGYIDIAIEEGARLVTGGQPEAPPHPDGYYLRPTLLADVTHDMRIAREEVFGPVLAVLRWSDEEDMIACANGVEYGLTASVWTRDLNRALKTVSRLEAGYIWVNNASDHFLGAPFGGYKQSGIGREECLEELLAYTHLKNVNVTLEA